MAIVHYNKWKICLAVFLFLGMTVFFVLNDSGRKSSSPTVSSSSVPDLLERLPNLNPIGIDSCSYAVEKSTANSLVPSPSDTKLELKGSAKLSEGNSKRIRSRFDWKQIARADIPKSLLDIVPSGDILVSEKLNESFADNPRYAHGFVIMLADESSRTIFFLSTDMDHPIK